MFCSQVLTDSLEVELIPAPCDCWAAGRCSAPFAAEQDKL